MQSVEEFADIIESEGVSFDLGGGYHWDSAKVAARISARDAEWQARVDKLEAALNKIATYPIWVARNGRTNKDSAEMLNIARAAIKGAAHE